MPRKKQPQAGAATRDRAPQRSRAHKPDAGSRPVTLVDVAREADVAVGTASRVLSNAPNVNPESRRRVLEAVARLNYRRLRARRTPRLEGRGRDAETSRNVGLVLLGMDQTLVRVPVLSEILHGIEASVTGLNGNLLVANLPKGDHVPPFFRNGQVEGLIVKTSHYNPLPDPEFNPLVKAILRLPLVWIWAKPEGAPGDVCSYNPATVGRLAAGYLRARGHRRVGFLNPKKGKSTLERVKKHFDIACAQHGLDLTLIESVSDRVAMWPEPALTGPDEIQPLVDQWLAIPTARRPTAVFVPADNFTIQVNVALQARGRRIGRDVSVISLNNEKSLVQATNPTLTTIDVNAQRIGARCVEQLLTRISRPGETIDQTILLEPFLVEGGSVMSV